MAGQLDEGVLQGLGLGFFLEGGGRALGDDPAMVDDGHLVRHPVGLFHIVGGEENRDLLVLVQAQNVIPDVVAGLGVQPHGGLVQEQDLAGDAKGPGRSLSRRFMPPENCFTRSFLAVPQFDDLQQFLDAGLSPDRGTLYRTPWNSMFS